MKYFNRLGKIVVLVLTINSCNPASSESLEHRIVIAGRINDFEGEQGAITFMFSNIVDGSRIFEQVQCKINAHGSFKIDTIFGFPQEFLSPYGFLYCSPGDSIFLEIEDSQLQSIRGTAAKLNIELLAFRNALPKTYPDSTKSLSPDQFISYIERREQVYRDSLEVYIDSFDPGRKTIEWATDIIQYEAWCDLLRYPWLRNYAKHLPEDSIHIPDQYYSFLEEYDMNDFSLISRNHILFLQEYYRYCRKNPADSLKAVNELGVKGDTSLAIQMHKRMITTKTSGLTKELFLTKFYHSILKGRDTTLFVEYFDATLFSNDYFSWELQKEWEFAQNYLSNQSTSLAYINDYSEVADSSILRSIISQYRGNVIYIDFWAPWCGPCLREIPHTKELQKHFEEKDITFLFLGNQCREDAWKASIADNQLGGEHVLLTATQFAHLSSIFNIDGIPHYMIVDRNGRVVSQDAVRPSNENELKTELHGLLNENKP